MPARSADQPLPGKTDAQLHSFTYWSGLDLPTDHWRLLPVRVGAFQEGDIVRGQQNRPIRYPKSGS